MFLSLLAALMLLVAACEEDVADDPDDEPDEEEEEEPDEDPDEDEEEEPDEDPDEDEEEEPDEEEAEEPANGEVSFAWIPWEENIANTFLWVEILEREGYEASEEQYDVAPTFAAVAGGDEDVFLDMWLPTTHADYEEEFGDELEELGVWFDDPATVELTVPEYVCEDEGVCSHEDLAENPDLFGGEITGIEAGAGMMQTLDEEVMPTYGLDEEFDLIDSSTSAMRAELETAYDNEEPIVVTLWTPHPEYADKDLHILEDPEGAWGEGEELHGVARPGFSEDMPEVAEWLENFSIGSDDMGALQATIEEAGEGNEQEGAAEWVDENEDLVDEWLGR
ncbi:glycine betaine ABC transporter substrate-binding protein [Egibacter rhizosphaerae]|uniref:Glycine betaine ABC transporter substrate-binding protein n=1 Tax=Egibacter rhizosphaerae TaxID=1670831 RepID=A0A411YG40_9ACTN|nr:glycine betaine ABC transporter substrate-binding protein [Egibacter rhizosphaerae]QBI20188.1 glycine betaine ABC transporter substrate-binding protein [Egibacter rhizosphaerae]